MVIAGPSQGTAYSMASDRFSIGRDPQNHFSVADRAVSREPCVIVRQHDGFLLRDLGSHNCEVQGIAQLRYAQNTRVVEQRSAQPVDLVTHDAIQLARFSRLEQLHQIWPAHVAGQAAVVKPSGSVIHPSRLRL